MKPLSELLPEEKRLAFEMKFETRAYQTEIIEQLFQSLEKHTNPAVVLSSGLGNTFTALSVAILYRKAYPQAQGKVLLVLPSRLSLNVYKEHVAWVDDFANVALTDQDYPVQAQEFHEKLTAADILISNPRRLGGLFYRSLLPFQKLADFGLVIFDGYQEILDPFGRSGLLDNHADMLLSALTAWERPMIFFCTRFYGNRFWDARTNPQKLEVQTKQLQAYLPHVIIKLMGVYDPDIARRDQVLTKHLATNFAIVKQFVAFHSNNQHAVKFRQVVSQMRSIASGEKDKFILYFRKKSPLILPVDAPLRLAFQRLVQVIDLRLLLFEDLLLDQAPGETLIEFNQVVATGGRPRTYGSRINMNGKVRMIKEVVAEKGKKRGLIFCRNLEVCERLAGTFVSMGRNVSLIHRDIPPEEQEERVKNFKRFKGSLLMMTRTISAGGFAVPEAEYAIFYSPKHKEQVMWDEISRVQSTWKDPKEIYLLYYKGTGEEGKLNRLVWNMRARDNYQITSVDKPHEQAV
jgi:hypothetical protein